MTIRKKSNKKRHKSKIHHGSKRPLIGRKKEPRYVLDRNFEFFSELQELILNASPASKERMVESINRLGRVKLAIVSGIFMNREMPEDAIGADLLLVADDIDKRRLKNFLRSLEAEVGREITFAIMDREEFKYRMAMFDRFTRVMIEGPHEKLINRLGI